MRTPARRHDVLAAALRELGAALAPLRLAFAAAAEDPLRLSLPPLPAAGAATPSSEVLAAYAALYLHAELEEAGVLPAVEALAEQRHALALRERATAERLERFAQGARDYPARADRARLYARLFGLGPAAVRALRVAAQASGPAWGSDAPQPLDFAQRLLRLAGAVVRADAERARLGGQPGLASQAAWRAAAQELLALVAAQSPGSLVHWARRIHARSLQAFELLGDAGLMRQLVARTPWESLQRLLPEQDAARRDAAARRGAAGQALLRSLATAGDAPANAGPDAATVQAAVRWLVASGLPLPQAEPSLVPAPLPMPRTAFAAGAAPALADPLAEDALPEDRWAEATLP
ncbi:hypothetical protein [Ramlibacter sp. 2FC]|uniref:hypothetical protein n=1 Tax=Ramlibacter sp. 2FC TaxID=2502188 RepID=UPI0010F64F7E|nr:hypothetical protein [Ramlibacter sp. 2FC]